MTGSGCGPRRGGKIGLDRGSVSSTGRCTVEMFVVPRIGTVSLTARSCRWTAGCGGPGWCWSICPCHTLGGRLRWTGPDRQRTSEDRTAWTGMPLPPDLSYSGRRNVEPAGALIPERQLDRVPVGRRAGEGEVRSMLMLNQSRVLLVSILVCKADF